jgi:hypothetical protein
MKVSASQLQLNHFYELDPIKAVLLDKVIAKYVGLDPSGLMIMFKAKKAPGRALYKGCVVFPNNTETLFELVK